MLAAKRHAGTHCCQTVISQLWHNNGNAICVSTAAHWSQRMGHDPRFTIHLQVPFNACVGPQVAFPLLGIGYPLLKTLRGFSRGVVQGYQRWISPALRKHAILLHSKQVFGNSMISHQIKVASRPAELHLWFSAVSLSQMGDKSPPVPQASCDSFRVLR